MVTYYYFSFKVISVILVQASASLIKHHYTLSLILIYLLLSFISLVLVALVDEKLERREIEDSPLQRLVCLELGCGSVFGLFSWSLTS